MIRGNWVGLQVFFPFTNKGRLKLARGMDGLDVPYSKHINNNPGEIRLVPGAAEHNAVSEH